MTVEHRPIVLPRISEADPNGKLILPLGGEPSILNPILSSDSASSAVEGTIFSGMVRINERLEVVPDLASSWDVSDDGLTWTFHLRRNVKWHDGRPFTAEDVKFTFDSILNPKVNSVRRGDYIIDGVPIKFVVVDKHTVRAILPKPFAPFLVEAGMSIIPRHLLSGKDINTAKFNRNPTGTGPFKFKEWLSGDHVTVVRNDNYYLGKPHLAEIIFKTIPDANSRLVALKTGEIDQSDIPPKDYKAIRRVPGLNVFEYESLVYTYFGFNLKSPLFSDKRVRQALAHATNKDQLISLVLKGLGRAAYCPTSPVSWAYSNDVIKYEYDLEKARALLKESGWRIGKDGLLEKNGSKFEFTVLINQGNKQREKAAIILQQQWKKIGVKMDIRVMEWSAMLKIVDAPKDPKDFDAVIIGWSLGVDPDARSIWHSEEYPRGLNFVGYSNDVVDWLIDKGRTTMDKGERKSIYAKMNKIISDEQPYIFLWYPKSVVAVRDRVGGLLTEPGPTGPFLYIEDVFVRK
jgi:peptide/nickel transport system substrate-binding protein